MKPTIVPNKQPITSRVTPQHDVLRSTIGSARRWWTAALDIASRPRKLILRLFLEETWADLQQFDNLRCIEPKLKQALRHDAALHLALLRRASVHSTTLSLICTLLISVIVETSLWAYILGGTHFLAVPPRYINPLLGAVGAIVFLMTLFIMLSVPTSTHERTVWIPVVISYIGVGLLYAGLTNPGRIFAWKVDLAIAAISLLVVMFCVGMVITWLGALAVETVLLGRSDTRLAYSGLVYFLIKVLSLAEGPRRELNFPVVKTAVLRRLETIAYIIETDLPESLDSGDAVTELWWADTTRQIAAAVRDKKKWILTPKADTYDQFFQSIADLLVHVVQGDWDAMERMTPPEVSRPQALRNRATIVGRTLFLALFPLLLLGGIQLTPLAVAGTVRDYLVVGVLVWAALAVIAPLDSAFDTKIAAAKDIASLLRPGSDKKG